MNKSNDEHQDDLNQNSSSNICALDLMRQIDSGKINPTTLSKESRLACVEVLLLEGYSVAEIAQILRCSDRTVRRDRKQLRQIYAARHDEYKVGLHLGQLLQQADTAISHIRRALRDDEATPADRVKGELACWKIANDLANHLKELRIWPDYD